MKRHILARCCGRLVLAPLVVAALGAGTPAFAIDEEVLLTTAEQACLAGNYQRGVEILANLYLATRKAAYLHNQARCYEQNGQNEAAIGRYNEFLRQVKNLPVEKKGEIDANIARLEQKIARQRVNEGQAPYYGQQPPGYATPGQPQAPQPPVAQPPQQPNVYQPYQQPGASGTSGTASGPAATVTAPAKAAPESGSKGLRIAGIVTAAVGAGALVLGAASGLVANDSKKKVEDDVKAMNPYDAKEYQNGKDSAALATVGFIAAPVLVGAGAVMYWLGMSSGSAEKSAYTVMPSVALGRGGAKVNLSLTY